MYFNSMAHSLSYEVYSSSPSQEVPCILCRLKIKFPYLQEPVESSPHQHTPINFNIFFE